MKPVCVVAGVGPGNGAAFARRFASEGYAVALLARSTSFSVKVASTLPDARVYECDVAAAGSIARAFDGIRLDLPEVAADQRARRLPRLQAGHPRDEARRARQ